MILYGQFIVDIDDIVIVRINIIWMFYCLHCGYMPSVTVYILVTYIPLIFKCWSSLNNILWKYIYIYIYILHYKSRS